MARPRKVVPESAPVTETPVAVVAPVTLQIEAPKNIVAEQKPRQVSKPRPYFLGTTDDCPYWNLNLAGVTFHRETAELMADKRGQDDILTQGPPIRGHLEMLTVEAIERIKKACKTKVIRWNSPPRWEVNKETGKKEFRGNGRIYSSGPRGPDAPAFIPQDNDEPIGKYIYLMPADTVSPTQILSDRQSITVKTVYEAMEDGTL